MGLDMYLTRKTYVKRWEHQQPSERYSVTVRKGGKVTSIKPERVCHIEEEVMYWRKANAIHDWFVKNVQNGVDECQPSYVSVEQLQELLNTVKKVLSNKKLSVELLPPTSGFFFGSTDIDDWYFQDLEDTRVALENILAEDNSGCEFVYQASW